MIHFPCLSYMTTRFFLFVHKLLHHADKLPPVFNSYIYLNRSIYQYNTRGKLNLCLNTPHSTFGKRLLKYKDSVLWNNLPEKLKLTENITTFKKLLRNILLYVLINLLWTCT